MRKLKVCLKSREDRSYRIHIGAEAPELLPELAGGRRVALVADANADRLHGGRLTTILDGSGATFFKVVVPSGEQHKTRETKAMIEDSLLAAGLDRHGLVVAFGGGVTGDMAGFVAATYLRGVPCIQVPTTLLSQVDSSVGGKTGIDTPAGKNMIGAFHQPAAVLIDPAFLLTLPAEEYLSGLGEVLKHALLFSPRLYQLLLERHAEVLARTPALLEAIIAENCSLKARVVERDPGESEYRKTLNLGHTAAHAIEQTSGFTVKHGIAVLQGMCLEACIGITAGLIREETVAALWRLVTAYLPDPGVLPAGLDDQTLLAAMRSDKKNSGGKVFFTLPEKIGKPLARQGRYAHPVAEETILQGIALFRKRTHPA